MNWLDPGEVEKWLAEAPNPGVFANHKSRLHWARQQFVRALDADEPPSIYETPKGWCANRWVAYRAVARLLVKAMEGE